MMNLLQVQDDLKNFSQDQLVKEMQQPTGSTPQFLVLSELNRRKRVKGDFEARQAQQQPTVAEEAVASAGVPQQGMMGMSEAMAPQSAVSEGVGTNAPMKMASGGLAQFGNEIRQGMGQEIDPYLDGVQQEAEQKFNIDLDNNITPEGGPSFQMPGPRIPMLPQPFYSGHRGPGSPGTMQPIDLQRPLPPQIGIGGKGAIRPAVMPRQYLRGGDHIASMNRNAFGARGYAEGGVVRAQDGLPKEPKFGDDLVNYVGGSFPAAIENLNTLGGYLNPFNYFGSDEDKETGTVEEVDTAGIDTATNDATAKMPEKKPEQKLNLTSEEPEVLSIEQELLKRQAGLDKDRNFDKYMALAQAGLGILASDKPTLAQAVGEGGMKGLDAFNEANKRYEEGLNDILNARSKLQQAKIKASGKGTLDRKGALAAISSYNNDITAVRKAIQDVNNSATDPREQAVRRAALEQELNRLRYEQSQLYDSAGIRQRPTVNVAGLPATQKSG
jgi:hypothetical protein